MSKKYHALWCAAFLMMLLFFVPSCPADSSGISSNDVNAVMNLYFDSLKSGDTAMVLDLLDGNALKRKKMQLQSKDYSTFLRQYYANSELNSIRTKELSANKMECDLEIQQGANIIFFKFILSNTGNGWKIVDEITQ